MKASLIITTARELVGVPYRHQGRSARGIDCVGLLLLIAERTGLLALGEQPQNYGRLPTQALIERLRTRCDPLHEPEAGAIIAIRWPGDRTPSHVAICTGGTIIHAYMSAGRVVEHGYRMQWVKWTDSIWWVRGVARG